MNNINKPSVSVFDFDGTLTKKDTTLPLATHFMKNGDQIIFLKFIYYFILFKFKLVSNYTLKVKFVECFIKNKKYSNLKSKIDQFNQQSVKLNSEVYQKLILAIKENERVLIVSANFDLVIYSWLESVGLNNIEVISTRLAQDNGTYTGEILGNICRGQEKSLKLQEALDINNYFITSYADESSDKYIMKLADNKIWVQEGLLNETYIQDQS